VGALSGSGTRALRVSARRCAGAGQATRDRITGQTSLFDMASDVSSILERPLPVTPETPVRERLRWEKELLGLYLSDHPMGEVAERVSQFVTAYSGDLKDESLDGQRVVIGGIVTGSRTIITKSKSTMAVVTLEDLQGTVEVVVFPRTYEQTLGQWREGAILLVAGRVDHRGEEASLLSDAVWDWDAAADRGAEAFAREVGALDRRGGGRRGGPGGGNGSGYANGNAGWW
jgi:DNA polymerase-3 subunit alpha